MPEDPVICRSSSRFFGGHKTSHGPIYLRHRLSVPRHAERCHDPVEREIRMAPTPHWPPWGRSQIPPNRPVTPTLQVGNQKMHEAGEAKCNYPRGKISCFFIWPAACGHGAFRVLATAPVVIRHVSAISETRELREPRCRSCRGGQMGDVGQHPLHIRFDAAVAGDLAAAVHGHNDIGNPEHLFQVR